MVIISRGMNVQSKSEQYKEPMRLPIAMIQIAKESRSVTLVKGLPGTGKTSLALEIAAIVGKAIVVTRGRDFEAIRARFPWIQQEALAVLNV
jgi:Holliday junction resolvasome RuvABC ATP-dependent DNA helicase subunit